MKIQRIKINKIKDSRGKPTIEIVITNEKGESFAAKIPSGKSIGSREAAAFSVQKSKKSAKFIEKRLKNKSFNSIKKLDRFLTGLDGTAQKKKLGGNVLLGISIAFARMKAAQQKKELWRVLRSEFFPGLAKIKPPFIFSNMIEGGVHTKNNLNIQEYLIIAKTTKTVSQTIKNLKRFYKKLGQELKKQTNQKIRLGDEGSYSLNFRNNFAPLLVLSDLIHKSDFQNEIVLGIDAAASEFYKHGHYAFESKKINSQELTKIYQRYFRNSPLLYSIEDPFDENDAKGFKNLLKSAKNKLIMGDDITTTNPKIIKKYIADKIINSVIIKPNQIGTVSEACQAIKIAHQDNVKCIISHRAGETPDAFIIQLAKASNAFGVKIGAPVSHRLPKFKELIRLYK